MSEDLARKHCRPCEGGKKPLLPQEVRKYLNEASGWKLSEDERSISKLFKLTDFKEALALTNEIGDIAEYEGHHPDIELSWGKLKVTLWTHAIGGLSENDFILAAKINQSVAENTRPR